jgi:hypothetical protein
MRLDLERLHGIQRIGDRTLVVLGAARQQAARLAGAVERERRLLPLRCIDRLHVAVRDQAEARLVLSRLAEADHGHAAMIREVQAKADRFLPERVLEGGVMRVALARQLGIGDGVVAHQPGQGVDDLVLVGIERVPGGAHGGFAGHGGAGDLGHCGTRSNKVARVRARAGGQRQ